jgi:hypothetical protein
MGDMSEEVLLGVVFFGGDFTEVAAVWLTVTPFLTVLMFCGANFFLEIPHRVEDMASMECDCNIELAVDEE